MRLITLDLRAYGHFSNKILDLGPEKSNLWIVYGTNEAGKSTALAAITDFLFGFGKQTPYSFLHDNANLRIGATLANSTGETLTALRRKGTKETLKDLEDRPLDQNCLHPFLGGLGRDQFEHLYGMDHEGLRSGGESALTGKGEIGMLLFAAGSGIPGIRTLMGQIRTDAEKLFTSRRSATKTLYSLQDRLREVRRSMEQSSLSLEKWLGHRQHKEKLQEELTTKGEEIKEKRRQEGRYRRIVMIGPMIVRLEKLRHQLQELKDTPALGEGLLEDRAKLVRKNAMVDRDLENIQEELKILAIKIAELHPEEHLSPFFNTIQSMYGRSSSIQDNRKKLPGLEFKLASLNNKQADLWQEVGGTATEINEKTLPDKARLAALHRLMDAKPALQAKIEEIKRDIASLHSQFEKKQAEIVALEPIADLSAFKSHLPTLRILVTQDREALDAFDHGQAAQKQAAEKLLALPLWHGTLAELEGCRPPTGEMIERFIREYQDGESERQKIENSLMQLRNKIKKHQESRSALQRAMGGEPPTDAAVLAARHKRDQEWHSIRHRWLNGGSSDNGNKSLANSGYLPGDTFEILMVRADQLADARLREAERLAKLQQIEEQIQDWTQEERQLLEEGRIVAGKREALLTSWRGLWQTAGVAQPGIPSEMRGWPTLRLEIVQLSVDAGNWHGKATTLRQNLSKALVEPNKTITSLGWPEHQPGEELAVTLSRWENLAAACATRVERQAGLKKQAEEIEHKAKIQREKFEEYKKQLRDNDLRWKTLMGQFGHELGMDVESSREFLSLFDELRTVFNQREEVRTQIQEITQQRDAFLAELRHVAVNLGEEWDTNDQNHPFLWLENLKIRADKAADGLNQLRNYIDRRESLGQKQQQCQTSKKSNLEQLREIQIRYGTSVPEEMDKVEERVRLKAELVKKIIECEGEIVSSGEGLTLPVLIEQIQGENGEQAKEKLQQLGEEIDKLSEQLRNLDQRLGGETRELENLTGIDGAAQAQQEMEDVSNELLKQAEHHVHLHLAATLLQQVITRYQEKNQGPVLTHAASFFRQLTLGSFVNLKVDIDDKNQTFLFGIRPGGERVGVEGMSDGTRDQLFLALRLGTLKALDKRVNPLPLILDDLLIHFDDQRTAATLKILANLQRQVLYFTHHPHLLNLAETHLAPETFGVRCLQ